MGDETATGAGEARRQAGRRRAAAAPARRRCRWRPVPALVVTTDDGISLSTTVYGPPDAEVGIVFGHGFTGTQHNPKVVELATDLVGRGLRRLHRRFPGPRRQRGSLHPR